MKKITKAVIPVAGLGTRFLPFTKAVPKEMLPIIDKPTIQYIVEEAVASGITDIIFIIAEGKEAVQEHFNRNRQLEEELIKKGKSTLAEEIKNISNLVKIYTVKQDIQLGLGHAILQAKEFVGDDFFALLLGDDVIFSENETALNQLIKVHERTQMSVIGVQSVPLDQVVKYGVVSLDKKIDDKTWTINGIVEKPKIEMAPSTYTAMGRYILDSSIFSALAKAKIDPVVKEITMTDGINKLIEERGVISHNFEGTRYDMGSKIGYLKANIESAMRTPDIKDEMIELMESSLKKYI